MDYKLNMYCQRAVIKTVAIISVPHSHTPRPWWQLAQAQAPTWNHSEPVGDHATARVLGYHKPISKMPPSPPSAQTVDWWIWAVVEW